MVHSASGMAPHSYAKFSINQSINQYVHLYDAKIKKHPLPHLKSAIKKSRIQLSGKRVKKHSSSIVHFGRGTTPLRKHLLAETK